ncbi:MAG: glutaredoxin 3 [Robiginitomaculum sp.]|nr:MAG: glutaredoxin 3 [Robiginitomaculum sp.]
MKTVTLYTRALCPYCMRAVAFLEEKNIPFDQIDAGMDAEMRREMLQRANGGTTYPQIFVGDYHIGGCDDLLALEYAGKFDVLVED